jgi:protoheme IX farnesyltransferase
LSNEGWTLFAILAFWQLPHFFAIAWMYRDDYAKAGFVMLPNVDADGRRTGQQAVWNTIALTFISVLPFAFHMAGMLYLVNALVLGAVFLWFAVQFSRELTLSRARQLFLVSIIYLPLLLSAMVWDKLK